jgi:hypothetical protein
MGNLQSVKRINCHRSPTLTCAVAPPDPTPQAQPHAILFFSSLTTSRVRVPEKRSPQAAPALPPAPAMVAAPGLPKAGGSVCATRRGFCERKRRRLGPARRGGGQRSAMEGQMSSAEEEQGMVAVHVQPVAAAMCRDELGGVWALSRPDMGPRGRDCCVLWRLRMARGTARGRRPWAR